MITFRNYLESNFGVALQKISINLYLSCPNRVNGGSGCLFCAEDGARARHLSRDLNLAEQVKKGREYVAQRYHSNGPFIAYFQAYTNTFAPIDKLRALYEEVLALAEFKVVMISTRPDCLDDEVLNYLQSLSKRYDVWVELGVQTTHDQTLKRVNRGHNFACSEQAITALHQRGIKVVAHMILGLPTETPQMILESAERLKNLPLSGIKLHQMMVLKGTGLAQMYHEHPDYFHLKNEYDYGEVASQFLKILPSKITLMRINADADPQMLLAPKWGMKKGQFLNYFEALMRGEDGVVRESQDHSKTVYHKDYKQHFHSLAGAQLETDIRFIQGSDLKARLESANVTLLDIGFGLGYNALSALECAEKMAKNNLQITSTEREKNVLEMGLRAQENEQRQAWIKQLMETNTLKLNFGEIKLYINDIREVVKNSDANAFDIIFLDAFSPDVNCECWSYDLFRELYRILKNGGILCTYSSAYSVIHGLMRARFKVGMGACVGEKRFGLKAFKGDISFGEYIPLREKEYRIACEALAGICYRDTGLNKSRKLIELERQYRTEQFKKRGMKKWI